jgi:hypothetical protein
MQVHLWYFTHTESEPEAGSAMLANTPRDPSLRTSPAVGPRMRSGTDSNPVLARTLEI